MKNNGSWNGKRHPVTRTKRRLRLTYLRILRIDDPPERIARGAAIGVLMGVLPTFGLGTFLSLGFAFIFRANKAAAVLGSFVVNPITSPFFWTLSIMAGALVLGEDAATVMARVKSTNIWNGIGWAYVVFLVGNSILSIICTAGTYFLIKKYIIRHREHKARKLEKARQRNAHKG